MWAGTSRYFPQVFPYQCPSSWMSGLSLREQRPSRKSLKKSWTPYHVGSWQDCSLQPWFSRKCSAAPSPCMLCYFISLHGHRLDAMGWRHVFWHVFSHPFWGAHVSKTEIRPSFLEYPNPFQHSLSGYQTEVHFQCGCLPQGLVLLPTLVKGRAEGWVIYLSSISPVEA